MTLPPPEEVAGLASSYDRNSKYDEATDKYINRGANGDGDGIIREEGHEQVLAEIQGPGCIWRTWSAGPGNGHVKIYLDGSSTPRSQWFKLPHFHRGIALRSLRRNHALTNCAADPVARHASAVRRKT